VTAAVHIVVRGAVQGVGFRPFAWRLARDCGLMGRIRSGTSGVLLDLEGESEALARFQARLVDESPPGAQVDAIEVLSAPLRAHATLEIAASETAGAARARVPPDLATCAECRDDVLAPGSRRHGHPFASCTHCGPRYSIVRAMPYDRAASTMEAFAPCEDCAREYRMPADRRFHAQPIACPACGPRVALLDAAGAPIAGAEGAIAAAAARLEAGAILALRGLGGFQLLVRADDGGAVARLRERKDTADRLLGGHAGYYRPSCGFFLWVKVDDGLALTRRLWRDFALRVLPGTYLTQPGADGANAGDAFVRIALVHELETTVAGLSRLAAALGLAAARAE